MSEDYRLQENLQRIIEHAGKTPHWNTASDNLDLPQTFTHAEVEAAVKRAIESCARKAEKLSECCQSCASVGREVRALASDPEAIAKIVEGK